MDNIFASIFATSMNIPGVFIALGSALGTGFLVAWICSFRLRASKGVFIAGTLLPAVVGAVFILSGYYLQSSASIAVRLVSIAVAFGLIRFRSVPAKAEELVYLALAVTIGFAFGLGYIAYGVIIGIGLAGIYFGITFLPLFTHKRFGQERLLKITIPESLDYSDVFEATFRHYTRSHELVGVKTTNMGSMFRLSYRIVLKDINEEKEFIDELRQKNGNLEISVLPYVEERASL